ncbi:MAG: CoA transferase, partial [Chitinophagales bacterium]|nr:CoA transferase [Chitinophagales bacterium]
MFPNPIYPTMQQLVVVELASVLAGPSVGMFFAELGARVIKVENKKTKGDVTRTWKLPQENPQDPLSAYYCSVNWN